VLCVVLLIFPVLSACMLQVDEPSYGRVLDCCKEAIERVPENVKAHYRCGVALFHLSRYDDAVSSLQKAAELQGKTGAYIAVDPQLRLCHELRLNCCLLCNIKDFCLGNKCRYFLPKSKKCTWLCWDKKCDCLFLSVYVDRVC